MDTWVNRRADGKAVIIFSRQTMKKDKTKEKEEPGKDRIEPESWRVGH